MESEQLYRESLEKSGDHETTYNNLGPIDNNYVMVM